MAQRCIRYLDHVLRRPDDHATSVIYATSTNLRQARGRPRSRWKDLLRQDLQLINLMLEDIPKLCQNRERDKMALVGSNPAWHDIWQQLQQQLATRQTNPLLYLYLYFTQRPATRWS